MLSWEGIVIEITWGKTALLHCASWWTATACWIILYILRKNCHLGRQTTVFTCTYSCCLQNLRLNASAWVKEWAECILSPLKYEQNKSLHREKQSVWNFLHYLTIPLTKPTWSADSAMSNNGPTNGSAHYRNGPERELPRADLSLIHQHEKQYVCGSGEKKEHKNKYLGRGSESWCKLEFDGPIT